MLYDHNTNTSVLVDEFYTQAGSGTYTYLQNQNEYRFAAYTTGNPPQLLAITNYLTAAPCSSTACPYVIQVGNFTIQLTQQQLKNFKSSCIPTPGTSNTETVSCTFTSLNGTTYNTSLVIQNTSYVINNTACQKYLTTKSGSLNCNVGAINNTFYKYTFSVLLKDNYWYPLQIGSFGSQPLLFGNTGVWLSLLIVVAFAMLYITKSPTLTVLSITIGFTVEIIMRLVNAGALTLGFAWIATALILYVINRR